MHAQLSWLGVLTRVFLASANKSDGEIIPILLEGTTNVVLGDRKYWQPDLQAYLQTQGIVLHAPFRKEHSSKAAAYQNSGLERVRYLKDTVFGQLTDRCQMKRIGARDLWNPLAGIYFDAYRLLVLQSAREVLLPQFDRLVAMAPHHNLSLIISYLILSTFIH